MSEDDRARTPADLPLSDRTRAWLDRITTPERPPAPAMPNDAEADANLARCGVRAIDREDCLAARPDPERHPALWEIFRAECHEVRASMGRSLDGGWYNGWPDLPQSTGQVGAFLVPWVMLTMLPETEAFHQSRGIPESVATDTLMALGQELQFGRDEDGTREVRAAWTLPLVMQGASYRLGRHMFDRYGTSINVHVPAGGSLAYDTSQASFDAARAFFPRHFPEDQIVDFQCHSWLMDDQLASYLPEDSNIIRFQRRFTVTDENTELADRDILLYIFSQGTDGPSPTPAELDALPQTTTLERAYVAHLRAGKHWWSHTGRFPFATTA